MKEPIKVPFEESFRFTAYSYPIYLYEIENFEDVRQEIVSEIDTLENKLTQNRSEYEKSPYFSDGDTDTDNVLTNCHKLYNFLEGTSDAVQYVKSQIRNFATHFASTVFDYNETIRYYSWCNKIKNENFLAEHSHGGVGFNYVASFSANLSVSCDDTYTYYATPYHDLLDRKQVVVPNINGYVTMFPNCLRHGTVPNLHKEGMRYTLGIDLFSIHEDVDVPQYIIGEL